MAAGNEDNALVLAGWVATAWRLKGEEYPDPLLLLKWGRDIFLAPLVLQRTPFFSRKRNKVNMGSTEDSARACCQFIFWVITKQLCIAITKSIFILGGQRVKLVPPIRGLRADRTSGIVCLDLMSGRSASPFSHGFPSFIRHIIEMKK
jgi:hypothetical protein